MLSKKKLLPGKDPVVIKNKQGRIIPVCEPRLDGNEIRYLTECVRSGWVSSAGNFIGRFEDAFKKQCASGFAVARRKKPEIRMDGTAMTPRRQEDDARGREPQMDTDGHRWGRVGHEKLQETHKKGATPESHDIGAASVFPTPFSGLPRYHSKRFRKASPNPACSPGAGGTLPPLSAFWP